MRITRDYEEASHHFLPQSYVDDDDDVDYSDDDSSSYESSRWTHSPQPQPLQQQQPQPQRNHFCVICNKQFGSGKAYGGHVRIHSIEYNNNKGKKMKMKKKSKSKKKKRKIGLVSKEKKKEMDLIRADVDSETTCYLCGKVFQTMHSLFGHMRRHPDRNWKGIRPPSSPHKFLDVYGDDVMMSRSMMKCDADVKVAACILMMMSRGGMVKKAMVMPKSEVRSSDDDGEEMIKRDGGEMDDDVVVDRKTKMELRRGLCFDLNEPYHGEEEEEDHPYYWN